MSQTIWKYNDVELEFDIADSEDGASYEKCILALKERESSYENVGMNSEIIKRRADNLNRFFDELFGEGTSVKLVGDKLNARSSTECYLAFLRFVDRQAKELHMLNNQLQNLNHQNRNKNRKPTRVK